MGMPVFVEVVDAHATQETYEQVFAYFTHVDETFSTYKEGSEISAINKGILGLSDYSDEMKEVFERSEETRKQSYGYFNIKKPDGSLDPSGLVKGWAINRAAQMLTQLGFSNFYLEAGGDIQTSGKNSNGQEWSIGIRSPFFAKEIVKIIYPRGAGVATSGTYLRGRHIYNPHEKKPASEDLVSLTVVGKDVYEADRFATAAFAMGEDGIQFIERFPGLEGYAVTKSGIATMTSGFERYTKL